MTKERISEIRNRCNETTPLMTLKELEQIIYIKSEIDVLTKRLKKLTNKSYVGDYAKDYSTGYERIITIRGQKLMSAKKIDKLTDLLEKRKKALEESVLAAELYIESIPDSKIRTLLTLRFLEGEEWEVVAKKLYRHMTADAARKAVFRFFENLS